MVGYRERRIVPINFSAGKLPNEVPGSLASRLLSVRAFDGRHFLHDADVVDGRELADRVRAFFGDERVAYLHVHNARHGCYAACVTRA